MVFAGYFKNKMSATNMTIATPKPCMYYDYTYPFAGFKKLTDVDAEAIRNKQYNYPKAFISHGESIEEPVDQDTIDTLKKQYSYPKAFISHGEGQTGEEIPEIHVVKQKKYMWSSFVEFFKQKQKFQRYPFLYTPNI